MSNPLTYDPMTSKLGTYTPKYFTLMPRQQAEQQIPTGLAFWQDRYQRIPLALLFPQLQGVNLWTYWHLRIACCARLLVRYGDRLTDCDVCHSNRGFVCPSCLGACMVIDPTMACPVCTYDRVDDKNKLVSTYDEDRELAACQRWLATRFPYGVPRNPSDEELRLMDAYTR